MLQPGAETSTTGEASPAANGAHRAGGAHEPSSAIVPIRDEESKGRSGGGEESGGGGSGGSRWPRQETLALLQIRSDMDAVFRDSSHKGPLWEEISRKMAESGFRRSAKKCREKFENVYKYHKRTKDGRSSKSDGKTYRFFDQLEALEAANSSPSFLPPVESGAVPIAMAMPPRPPQPPTTPAVNTISITQPQVTSTVLSATQPLVPTVVSPAPTIHHVPALQAAKNANPMNFPSSTSGTPSSSSSTSSDEDVMKGMSRSKRKRKWKGFFEKLARDVMEKQEDLQRKFLEAIEKRENDRRVRDEAWKAQELARLKREHDVLVQERSAIAAKDAALVAFLQKLSDQKQIPIPANLLVKSSQPPPPPTPTTPAPQSAPVSQPTETNFTTPVAMATKNRSNGGSDPSSGGSSSRWPKSEIDALIKLRTNMDHRYQENGPKGALWEEISGEMKKLGYNRNAKRCKEKWENINKYFKKVKENNKRRREDSKTCPYYSQLEALYREKKPKQLTLPPISVQPEQQWPLHDPNENLDHDDEDDDDEYDDDDDMEGGYEIVANNSNAGGATSAMETS
ncbi:uncharacterized protein [Phyllobates terribilis]|uniref:uncharacterized protein n=1 Tax=Phyllobates terribilis TaxID=111132 RepID=UPI003CCA6FFB